MANLPLTEIVVPDSEDVLELAPDLSDEVTALQGAVNTLNTDVSNIPNGTYPNLTAGSILTDKYDIDTTPYLYRALPYRSKRLEDVIVGGSVVWNQLCNATSVTVTSGHKYYMKKGGTETVGASDGTALTGLTVGTDIVRDLTQMLGSTIADYINSLGSTDGVAFLKRYFITIGVYDSYDTGTIKSVNPTAHVTRGVNAWDEEWGNGYINTSSGELIPSSNYIYSKNLIPIVSGANYYIKTPAVVSIHKYDASGNYIGSLPYTWGNEVINGNYYLSGAAYIRFNSAGIGAITTYSHDICINISDPTINGKYFPYEEHTYPLGDVTLRGIPKLVNNELVYDGDIYRYDGGVQRNTIFRAYQAGDESLANAITDGTNTVVYSSNASTETTTPFEQYQICETGGTEEYTTTNGVPVGHETKYFTDVIGNIENIPAPPTTNGTYTLKVTVSASGNTYAWV